MAEDNQDKPEETRFEKLRRERKFMTVPLDINLLGTMFLNPKYIYKFEGLPEDAIFVHADRDIQSQSFDFIYLHESFGSVPEGVRSPIIHIAVTQRFVEPEDKDITNA
jgi:hypothetical protein